MMQAISRRSINHQFLDTSAVKSLTSFSNSGFGVSDDHHPRYASTLANKGVGHLVRKGTGGRSSVSASKQIENENSKSLGRKAVSTALICVTGGVALSAIDDLAIYHGCSSKAMEKASKNEEIIQAIGEPVVKGPWYDASLAITHKRKSVSCTFPVSGQRGNGVLRLKAVRDDDGSWLSFFRPREYDILILDAVLYIPGNDETQRSVKISVSDNTPSPASQACVTCPKSESPKKQCEKNSFNSYTKSS